MIPNFFSHYHTNKLVGDAKFRAQFNCRILEWNILSSYFNHLFYSKLGTSILLALAHPIFKAVTGLANIFPIRKVTEILTRIIRCVEYFSDLEASLTFIRFWKVLFEPKVHCAVPSLITFPMRATHLSYLRDSTPFIPSFVSFSKWDARSEPFDEPAFYITHRL